MISGQVVISSRLSQHLEVRLLATQVTKEVTSVLQPCQTLPSWLIEHDEVRAIRVRLMGVKMPWSQEIGITGEKAKESRLIKVSSLSVRPDI